MCVSLRAHVHVSVCVCAHTRVPQEQAESSKGFLVLWRGPSSDSHLLPCSLVLQLQDMSTLAFCAKCRWGEGESPVRRKPGCSVAAGGLDSTRGRVEGDPHQSSTWRQGEDRWGQNTSSLALERGEWGKDTHRGGKITKGSGE